ncbi:MAG TPA: anthranilate synthase component I, partial [Hellea balneolensis]|nr:anthranilate synthase component I [Hellea balneolensis]
QSKPFGFLLESVQGGEQRGRYSIIGFAPDLVFRIFTDRCEIAIGEDAIAANNYRTLEGRPIDELRALQAQTALDIPQDLPPMVAGLFGYIGYDMVRQIEHLPDINPDPLGTPDTLLTRPSVIAVIDQIAQEILVCTTVRASSSSSKTDAKTAYNTACERIQATILDLETQTAPFRSGNVSSAPITPASNIPKSVFCRNVEKAKAYIKAGDIFQVVIGQRFEAPLEVSPFALYRSLRRLNPSPFLYFLNFGDHAVVGSSPEILVRLREGKVTVRPIAGTRPRGKTPEMDQALERELLADQKECAEHLMLLDLGRNDIGRVPKAGTINVTERFVVERYSHVMHIVSNVEGDIRNDCDTFDALYAGFPAGTVSGAPKVRAMEIIDELETEKRGIYAGAVGYISANGDMDTAIALRTAVVKDGVIHVRAGAGIVLDSDADSEYAECENKAKAIFYAAERAKYFDRN